MDMLMSRLSSSLDKGDAIFTWLGRCFCIFASFYAQTGLICGYSLLKTGLQHAYIHHVNVWTMKTYPEWLYVIKTR